MLRSPKWFSGRSSTWSRGKLSVGNPEENMHLHVFIPQSSSTMSQFIQCLSEKTRWLADTSNELNIIPPPPPTWSEHYTPLPHPPKMLGPVKKTFCAVGLLFAAQHMCQVFSPCLLGKNFRDIFLIRKFWWIPTDLKKWEEIITFLKSTTQFFKSGRPCEQPLGWIGLFETKWHTIILPSYLPVWCWPLWVPYHRTPCYHQGHDNQHALVQLLLLWSDGRVHRAGHFLIRELGKSRSIQNLLLQSFQAQSREFLERSFPKAPLLFHRCHESSASQADVLLLPAHRHREHATVHGSAISHHHGQRLFGQGLVPSPAHPGPQHWRPSWPRSPGLILHLSTTLRMAVNPGSILAGVGNLPKRTTLSSKLPSCMDGYICVGAGTVFRAFNNIADVLCFYWCPWTCKRNRWLPWGVEHDAGHGRRQLV